MANLMGTNLFQAYDDSPMSGGNPNSMQSIDTFNVDSVPQSPSTPTTSNSNSGSSAIPPSMPPNHPEVQLQQNKNNNQFYDSANIYNEFNMQEQLAVLQHELAKQKELAKMSQTKNKESESIIDRFVSKKKEVFKLVVMSLTILLAMSIHYVMNDLLKNYLINNELSENQEFMTKLAYPITVLLAIWAFKVFNK